MRISTETIHFIKENCQIDENGVVTCFKKVNDDIIAAVNECAHEVELEMLDELQIELSNRPDLSDIPATTISESDIQFWINKGIRPEYAHIIAADDSNSKHISIRMQQLNDFYFWFRSQSQELLPMNNNQYRFRYNNRFYRELLNWQRPLVIYPKDNMGSYCVAVLKDNDLTIKNTKSDSFVTFEEDNNGDVELVVLGIKKVNLGKPNKWNAFLYSFLKDHPNGCSSEEIKEQFKSQMKDKGEANLTQKVTELNDKLLSDGFSYNYRIQSKKTGNKVDYYYIPIFRNYITLDVNNYKTLWDKACEGDSDALEKMDDKDIEFKIGFQYEFGNVHFPNDIEKAKEWYEKAIIKNHPEAMAHLARILSVESKENGSRVVELYSKSAELGCCIAQYRLGLLYKNGTFVNQDMQKAVALFESCAAQDKNKWCVIDARKELFEYYADKDKAKADLYLEKYLEI